MYSLLATFHPQPLLPDPSTRLQRKPSGCSHVSASPNAFLKRRLASADWRSWFDLWSPPLKHRRKSARHVRLHPSPRLPRAGNLRQQVDRRNDVTDTGLALTRAAFEVLMSFVSLSPVHPGLPSSICRRLLLRTASV